MKGRDRGRRKERKKRITMSLIPPVQTLKLKYQ